jgi:hypothetical protein
VTAFADGWGDLDQRYVEKVAAALEAAEQALWSEAWEVARRELDSVRWYFEQWQTRGLASDERVVALNTRAARLDQRCTAHRAIDPDRPGAMIFVRNEGGKKKQGGQTPAEPIKFLYRALERVTAGDELKLAGPFHGDAGAGHFRLLVPHVVIRGGFSADFTTRDLERFPTILSREPGAAVSSIQQHILEVGHGAGITLEGLVFDAQHHYPYNAQGLVFEKAASWALLKIQARRSVTIRHCVFVNAAGPAIDIDAQPGTQVTIEHCVFLNGCCNAIHFRGNGGALTIERCTFALQYGFRSRPGTAVQLQNPGSLVFRNNLVAYADLAVRTLHGNMDVTLEHNAFFGLSHGVLEYAREGHQRWVALAELDDVDVEAEGNIEHDPDLALDPESELRYLRNVDLKAWTDAQAFRRVCERAVARLPEPSQSTTEPVKDGPPTDDLTDPFAKPQERDPLAPDTPRDPPQGPQQPAPVRRDIPQQRWIAPAYPWKGPWPAQRAECDAGARLLRAQ